VCDSLRSILRCGVANAIHARDQLQQAGVSGPTLYPSDESFFQRVDPPKTIEIRYEAGIEDEAANALFAMLEPVSRPKKIVKAVVRNRTGNFISVFYPRGG
jgi:hypothetical protein